MFQQPKSEAFTVINDVKNTILPYNLQHINTPYLHGTVSESLRNSTLSFAGLLVKAAIRWVCGVAQGFGKKWDLVHIYSHQNPLIEWIIFEHIECVERNKYYIVESAFISSADE